MSDFVQEGACCKQPCSSASFSFHQSWLSVSYFLLSPEQKQHWKISSTRRLGVGRGRFVLPLTHSRAFWVLCIFSPFLQKLESSISFGLSEHVKRLGNKAGMAWSRLMYGRGLRQEEKKVGRRQKRWGEDQRRKQ